MQTLSNSNSWTMMTTILYERLMLAQEVLHFCPLVSEYHLYILLLAKKKLVHQFATHC
jgi:hypothetical protein